MILQSSRRLPLKLSFLAAIAMSSAGLCEEKPVNAAGYHTITLAEAGLSVMAPHPSSGTATSPEYARSVRRGGQTVKVDRARQGNRSAASGSSASATASAD